MNVREGNAKLLALCEEGWDRLYPQEALRVTVGMSTCGRAAGGDEVLEAVEKVAAEKGIAIEVREVGCRGWCWAEPVLELQIPQGPRAVYGHVEAADVERILRLGSERKVAKAKLCGITYRDRFELLDRWVELAPEGPEDIESMPFMAHQTRRLTAAWGHIEPWSLCEYAAVGGYSAMLNVAYGMSRIGVINDIELAGLRGRGGAGFPTGVKWRSLYENESKQKYIIANADEGDPGAYMDRSLLESNPHQLIEGMVIAGFVLGADRGFVFTRSEYPHAIEVLNRAIGEAEQAGFLGKDILGRGFDFTIEVVCSAGAYVCGEATAMVESMEGNRPSPRIRPPHMSERGLWDAPTCVNNVETLANIPIIVKNGSEYFRSIGTPESPGTKVFSFVGSIKHTGLIEIGMGMSVRKAVEGIGEVMDISAYHPEESISAADVAVQIGGPSGAVLPLELDGLTLDFEGLRSAGGIMGSGGIVVLGRESCVVDIARYFLHFSLRESCGRCVPCRDGLKECCDILDRVVAGTACENDLHHLETLCRYISDTSMCGLGKMATTPAKSSLRYFRDVYQRHLEQNCPTMVCKDLMHFEIIAEKCPPSCTTCGTSCPTNAIVGHYGEAFTIKQDLCTKCWMCTSQCPYGALKVLPEPYCKED